MIKKELSKLMRIVKIPYTLIIGLFHNILTPILMILLILMIFDYQQRTNIYAFVDTEIIESIGRCENKSFTTEQWGNIDNTIKQNNYSNTRLQIFIVANRYGYCGDEYIDNSEINIEYMINNGAKNETKDD